MDSVKKTVDTSVRLRATTKLPAVTTGLSDNIIGGYTFTNTNWNTPAPPMSVSQSGQISLSGDNADIVVNGVSLMDKINAIAERLNILDVNKELEAEWDQLRKLGEQYRQLELDLRAKSAMWETLKTKTPNKPSS
jgi:hypothetical protein